MSTARGDIAGLTAPGSARDADLLFMVDAGFSLDEIVAALGITLTEVHARLLRLRYTIEDLARESSSK